MATNTNDEIACEIHAPHAQPVVVVSCPLFRPRSYRPRTQPPRHHNRSSPLPPTAAPGAAATAGGGGSCHGDAQSVYCYPPRPVALCRLLSTPSPLDPARLASFPPTTSAFVVGLCVLAVCFVSLSRSVCVPGLSADGRVAPVLAGPPTEPPGCALEQRACVWLVRTASFALSGFLTALCNFHVFCVLFFHSARRDLLFRSRLGAPGLGVSRARQR